MPTHDEYDVDPSLPARTKILGIKTANKSCIPYYAYH